MLTLRKPTDEEVYISQSMVIKYKRQGDILLSEIRSVMTEQPLDFEYYKPWQVLCNTFYQMLEPLLYGTATEEDTEKNYKLLCKNCDDFLNEIKTGTIEYTFNQILSKIDKLKLVMLKLNYIVQTFGGNIA